MAKKAKARKAPKKAAKKPAKKTPKKAAAKTKKKPAKSAKAAKSASPKKAIIPKPVISERPWAVAGHGEILLGEVEDFFVHVTAIALTLKDALAVGDTLRVRGHTTNLTQKVLSIQMDRKPIRQARKGDAIGIQVAERCRPGDKVFRVTV